MLVRSEIVLDGCTTWWADPKLLGTIRVRARKRSVVSVLTVFLTGRQNRNNHIYKNMWGMGGAARQPNHAG